MSRLRKENPLEFIVVLPVSFPLPRSYFHLLVYLADFSFFFSREVFSQIASNLTAIKLQFYHTQRTIQEAVQNASQRRRFSRFFSLLKRPASIVCCLQKREKKRMRKITLKTFAFADFTIIFALKSERRRPLTFFLCARRINKMAAFLSGPLYQVLPPPVPNLARTNFPSLCSGACFINCI